MKTIFTFVLLAIVTICNALYGTAQNQYTKPEKFEEFGTISNGDAKARMDSLVIHLKDDSSLKAYIIAYGGIVYAPEYNPETRELRRRCYLPQRGQTLRKINFYRAYLLNRIDSSRVFFINGGYKERETTEFWLVSEGQEIPQPAPTVKAKDVKFRKGYTIRKRDIVKDC